MNIFQGILLGIVQGLAEFLPVSSSGHLILLRGLLGINDAGGAYIMFDILLHIATLLVVFVVFWKDWITMIKNPFKSKQLLLLFIASLPALLAVIGFDDVIDYLKTGRFLGFSFLITGILLCLSQKISNKNKDAVHSEPSTVNALAMGCAQILGLLPGISRSGSTIFGGIASKLDRRAAAKFSFMMSAPAILGSFVFELKNALEENHLSQIAVLPTLCGMIAAAVCGFFAIRFMLNLISRISLNGFAIYMLILGVLVVFLQVTNIIDLNLPDLTGGVSYIRQIFRGILA